MKKRTIKSFDSWEEVQNDELQEARKSTPQERMQTLYDLMELYSQLPQQDKKKHTQDPYIIRRKKS